VHLRLAGYKEGRVQLKKAGLCLFINQKEQKKTRTISYDKRSLPAGWLPKEKESM
jgi:hypothetical protein